MPRAIVPPAQTLPGSLILALCDLGPQGMFLDSVELLGSTSRLRISLSSSNRIDEVLATDANTRLARILGHAPTGDADISRPDIVLRLKELALGNLRMTTTTDPNGQRMITLIFTGVYGNLMSLFNRSVEVANAVPSQSDTLTDAALNRALIPLFEFAEFLETANDAAMYGDRARLYRHLSETRDRIRELELYHEALVQMANETPNDRFEGLPPPGTRLQ